MLKKSLIALGLIAFTAACASFSGTLNVSKAFVVKGSHGDVQIAKGNHSANMSVSFRYAQFKLSNGTYFAIRIPDRLSGSTFPSHAKISASEIGQNFDLVLNTHSQHTGSSTYMGSVSCRLSWPEQRCEYVEVERGRYERQCETVYDGTAPARIRRDDYDMTYTTQFLQKGSQIARFTATGKATKETVLEQGHCSL